MGKVVVITGAGSGIGRATARVLLDAGHQVVLAGRRSEPLVSVADGNPNARVVPTDVKVALIEALAVLDQEFGANPLMGRTRMQAATPMQVRDRIAPWAQ